MKKLNLATLLTALSCTAAYALPVGNPADATLYLNGAWWDGYCCNPCDPCWNILDAWSFRVGYYGDFVYDRHLETTSDLIGTHALERTELYTNAGYLALNVCDRIDVFGTVGATRFHIATDLESFGGTAPIAAELFFDPEFSWSAGARATLWECDCFFVGVEGQYFQTRATVDRFIDYTIGLSESFTDVKRRYKEWQVGLGASYRFATSCPSVAMIPYAAAKWGWARFDLNNFDFFDPFLATPLVLPNLKNAKTWGYAVGMSLTLTDMVGVNVEGRWGDERALSVIGEVRF